MQQSPPPLAILGNILNSTEFAAAAVGSRLCALRMFPAVPTFPRPCAINACGTCVIAGGSKVWHAMLCCNAISMLPYNCYLKDNIDHDDLA